MNRYNERGCARRRKPSAVTLHRGNVGLARPEAPG